MREEGCIQMRRYHPKKASPITVLGEPAPPSGGNTRADGIAMTKKR
jgi:hypothetical protein